MRLISCLREEHSAEQPWEAARLVASRIKRLAMENRAKCRHIHSPPANPWSISTETEPERADGHHPAEHNSQPASQPVPAAFRQ